MRRMLGFGLGMTLAVALAGCATLETSQIPLAKNVWQVKTEGREIVAQGVDGLTARRAAELTLAQGYDRFVIRNSQTAIVPLHDTSTYTKAVSVDVVMFHAGEPGAAGAVDAAAFLKGRPGG